MDPTLHICTYLIFIMSGPPGLCYALSLAIGGYTHTGPNLVSATFFALHETSNIEKLFVGH